MKLRTTSSNPMLCTLQVLRSKGFIWMSNSHATAFYWSHAGQHFEIRDEGDWWAAVDDEDWPEDPAQQSVIVGTVEIGFWLNAQT